MIYHRITLNQSYGDDFTDELKDEIRKEVLREIERRSELDLTSKQKADIVVTDIVIKAKAMFAKHATDDYLQSSRHQDLWDDDVEYKSSDLDDLVG